MIGQVFVIFVNLDQKLRQDGFDTNKPRYSSDEPFDGHEELETREANNLNCELQFYSFWFF